MIQTSTNKYHEPNWRNTNSNIITNESIISMRQKLRRKRTLYRTWFGVMISAIGLYLAAHKIGVVCNGEMSWMVFYIMFFICLCVIILGGWIVFLANGGEKWLTKY